MSYCIYCGNEGILPKSGDPCPHCKSSVKVENEVDLTCLEIPVAYRGATFNSELLPTGFDIRYGVYLNKLFGEITMLRPMSVNIFISSPAQSGKTVFAYSCMETLFRKKAEVFPLFDVSELECIIRDTDKGRKSIYLNEDIKITSLYESPFLFVRVPDKLEYSTPETIALIVDRRVRRGVSTIFLSNRGWTDLVSADKTGLLKGMAGDGSFKSILNKTFWKEK